MEKPVYELVLAELLTPLLDQPDVEQAAQKFGKRFGDYYGSGLGISLPDNPMGNLRFTSTEVLEFLELPCQNVIVHLNSFHRKEDFDQMLQAADALSVRTLLCISGDGNPKLHRLEPEELGLEPTPMGAATSVEHIKYIKREYPDRFVFGVAFNPYEKPDIEFAKMERKMAVGFDFIGTQLYLTDGLVEGFDHFSPLEQLSQYGKPVVFGIWTPTHLPGDDSDKNLQRIDIFLECISPYYAPQTMEVLREKVLREGYDPVAIMNEIRDRFSEVLSSFYFSLPALKRLKAFFPSISDDKA